ncbi:hypothetical protein [Roseateles microcysteis]|uniref:hypothetical protein n=1 Tax=Roseateles microcysteis TaxID=3119057 RepID=UPI002FE6817A
MTRPPGTRQTPSGVSVIQLHRADADADADADTGDGRNVVPTCEAQTGNRKTR